MSRSSACNNNVHSSNSHFCLDSALGIYSIIVTAPRSRDTLTSDPQLTKRRSTIPKKTRAFLEPPPPPQGRVEEEEDEAKRYRYRDIYPAVMAAFIIETVFYERVPTLTTDRSSARKRRSQCIIVNYLDDRP
ncbi:hypothetical protein ALC56_05684 [Trachymyrmex septentrionalis]|uniref:Uncharacterized protein n=1 Tax=Trachymyrmex septentrionalis TaxID=34720 RepID=A0A195FHS5_9HYME|nr:hypothetical protein ALC56_05684 [Trachymyrmex septentrionalis]